MAATIYSPPESLTPPDAFSDEFKDKEGKWDWEAITQAESDYVEELSEAARKKFKSPNPLIGKMIQFGVGDGYAVYVVWRLRPLQLVHVPIGDKWHFQYAHLLTVAEVRKLVESQERLAEIFGRSTVEKF